MTERLTPCPRCGAARYREFEPADGDWALKCVAGHLTGYQDKDGRLTPVDNDWRRRPAFDEENSALLWAAATIRAARQSRHLTQLDIAAALGVSQNLISAWERGRCCPRAAQQRKLTAFFTRDS